MWRRIGGPLLGATALAAACGDEGVRIGLRERAPADTVVFGQDRSGSPPSPTTTAAHERGRRVLEQLLDQYAGVGFLLEELEDGSAGALSRRAFRHERDEDDHERTVRELLQEGWGERYVPTVAPAFAAAADSIRRLPAERRDAALSQRLLAEHRRGVRLLDSAAPGLAGTSLERPLRRLSEELTEEVHELERRLGRP